MKVYIVMRDTGEDCGEYNFIESDVISVYANKNDALTRCKLLALEEYDNLSEWPGDEGMVRNEFTSTDRGYLSGRLKIAYYNCKTDKVEAYDEKHFSYLEYVEFYVKEQEVIESKEE